MPDISNYYVFLIPLFVGSVIHIIKFLVFFVRHDFNFKFALEHGTTYGHMPSSHTGFIISLLTSVGYYEGLASGAFAVATALTVIVIDDAMRLRMYMGDQGRYLNMISQELHLDPDKYPRLKERVGHRKIEIAVGAILGFVFTIFLAKVLG